MFAVSAVTFASQWAASVAADSSLDGAGVRVLPSFSSTALDCVRRPGPGEERRPPRRAIHTRSSAERSSAGT
jgi:hypothetical protein